VTNAEKASSMLGIVQAVHERGKAIIGPSWAVYDEMAALARADDVDGMITRFITYTRSARGIRLEQRLKVFGKTTLESTQRRFMGIARST
jgi:hypothetical protein